MNTNLKGNAYELYNNMLIAADMVANVEDRRLIYGIMEAAEKATLNGWNPRQILMANAPKFPHIELDMSYKNW